MSADILESSNGTECDKDGAAIHRFIHLQDKLLDFYGVKATSRFLELARPRTRIHLLEAGEGEPVVIIHGGDGEGANWAPLMALLQKHARLLAVDRPGFGLSDAFDYRTVDLRSHAADFIGSLFDALELDSATLIGGSMGGFFVLVSALAHPHRVRRLVLVGYAVGATTEISEGLKIICGTPGMAEQFMKGRDNIEAQKHQYREMFQIDPSTVPELYFETRVAGLRLPCEQGTWSTLLPRLVSLEGVRPEIYLGDELPMIQAPTLVIWGEHDMAPPEVGQEIAGRIPGALFELLPGIGHFPFLEAPARTAQLIAEFLSTTKWEA